MKKITLFVAGLLFTAFGYTAQAVESQTATCTAGNLATVAANYLTTVTNLTVTGTIDARDFKTMRDAMPLLAVIDLSKATVEAYTGNGGTSATSGAVLYAANAIPWEAFQILGTQTGKAIKSFIFPSSVTAIEDLAFIYCSSLTGSLNIPASVTDIGNNAFTGCSGLLSVDASNPNYSSLDGILFNKDKTTLIQCPLTKSWITIPKSVTTIRNYAFYNCIYLTGSLSIPSSITTIGSFAFSGCFGFTGSLTIPSSVKTIGDNAFYGCSGFNGSLTIPASITSIGNFVFDNCYRFTSIYALATIPIDIRASQYVFYNVNKTSCILHVTVGSTSLYADAAQWRDFKSIVADIPTSIDELLTSSISIYPNPATTQITISGLSSLINDKSVTLSVVDVLGSTVLVNEVESSLSTLLIDISKLQNSIYLMVIQTSNGSAVKRFIKE